MCAYDQHLECDVAIKIIKAKKSFFDQAQTELQLLQTINTYDTNNTNDANSHTNNTSSSNIVRLLDHFVLHKHQCLVFEMLSFNLYELLKNTR